MARPRKKIDPTAVKALAQRGSKVKEIASLLGCSPDTLQRRFAAELTKGREDMKMSLREWQIQAARKGNVAMLIWLGKQYLDQSDKAEQNLHHSVAEDPTDLPDNGFSAKPGERP